MESKAKTGVITAAVLALVVGGSVGYALGTNGSMENETTNSVSAQDPNTATKAADLRVLLNNLEAEHVDLASAATRAGFDGSPMFAASAASLDQNSVEISQAIGSVYGAEAEARFLEIWRSHIGFFVDYTVAAKAGDQAGMDKAVQDLNGYVEAVSTFLSGANENLPKDAVAALITEHVGLLKTAVDSHGAGDYAASYQAQADARDQITTEIADTLAGAIVKQNPDTFAN